MSLFISTAVLRDWRRRVVTGREGLVGVVATVRSPLRPGGIVVYEGERWRATSRGGPIEAGRRVRIVEVQGLDLVVEAAEESVAVEKE